MKTNKFVYTVTFITNGIVINLSVHISVNNKENQLVGRWYHS